MDRKHAGTGYLALPEGGSGPGLLVLHSWWGLTDHVRHVCDLTGGHENVACGFLRHMAPCSAEYARELPHEAGVVAIPTGVFSATGSRTTAKS